MNNLSDIQMMEIIHKNGEVSYARAMEIVVELRAAAAPQVVADEPATLEDQSYEWMAEQQIKGRAISETQRKIYLEGLAAAPAQEQDPVAWRYEWASFITGDGPQNFKLTFDVESPPEWAVKDGQARNVVKLFRAPVQPVAVPDEEEFGFKAVRLRRTAFLLGLEGAIPDNDKDLMDCMGAVLGMICREVERLAAPAAQGDAKDPERLRWLAETGARISWSMDGEYCAVWLPDERDGTESRPAEGYPLKCYDSWHRAIDAAIAAKAES